MMTDKIEAKDCAELLQALGEENRIRIIDCLRSGPKNVTELATMLDVEIVNVSHHLGVLRNKSLVLHNKEGRFVRYSLNPRFFSYQEGKPTYLDLGWCRLELRSVPKG